jgi:hypothetical protein
MGFNDVNKYYLQKDDFYREKLYNDDQRMTSKETVEKRIKKEEEEYQRMIL